VGATLPAPLYQLWFERFSGTYANVSIAYEAKGSIAGIGAASSRSATFGATDVAMTDTEIAAASGKLLHVPLALGAIVVVANVPGVSSLQLDGAAIASIYTGRITNWSDPAVAALNPGVALPTLQITVVHRSDPSGTTNGFVAYLDASSPDWHAGPGIGRTVNWPVGTGAAGDDGVAAAVKATSGSIGYAASTFAAGAGLRAARLKNAAATFVRPTTLAISAAAETTVAGLAPDFRQQPVVNAPGVNAYPIIVYAYVLLPVDQPNPMIGGALVALLGWCLTTGQADAAQEGYAALPGGVQTRALAALHGITTAGAAIWP
jgi:phosphate transport system substrate-binding protein